MHMNVAESEPEIPGNLNGAAGSPLSASSHRVSGKPPKGKSDPLLGRYLVGDYLTRPPPLAKDQDAEQPPKKKFLSTAAFELALGDGRTAQHGDVDHLFEECSEEDCADTWHCHEAADAINASDNVADTEAAVDTRIPGVGTSIATAEGTRGPSLLGAAPGECSSPAKAEGTSAKMSALQQHKRALAKSDLKEEFLSGAGCASLLLLDDSDIEQLLKENANISKCRRKASATEATAEAPATAPSSAAANSSYSTISSSNGTEECSEHRYCKRLKTSNFDDIHLDRRRVCKRKLPCGPHDDICNDRARIAKRMYGTHGQDGMIAATVLSSREPEAVTEVCTAVPCTELGATDAPT